MSRTHRHTTTTTTASTNITNNNNNNKNSNNNNNSQNREVMVLKENMVHGIVWKEEGESKNNIIILQSKIKKIKESFISLPFQK